MPLFKSRGQKNRKFDATEKSLENKADSNVEQTEESPRDTADVLTDGAPDEGEQTETSGAFDPNSTNQTDEDFVASDAENENAPSVEEGAGAVVDVDESTEAKAATASEEETNVAENLVDASDDGKEKNEENAALLREILDVATTLRQDFDVKFKYDKKKDEQVDRLYEECKAYRDDVFWTLKKDLILDVVCEIDDVEKRAAYFEKCERTPELCEKLLKFVRETAENLCFALEKHDVVAYSAAAGSRFDPSRQRALEIKPTNDETLDKTVAPVRKGFDYEANGKTRNVRKEIVYVYKYEPPTEPDALESRAEETPTPSVETVAEETSNVESQE